MRRAFSQGGETAWRGSVAIAGSSAYWACAKVVEIVHMPDSGEQGAHVGVALAGERAGVGPASAGGGGEVRHAVFSESDCGQEIVRGGFDAHLAVSELMPCSAQA